MRNKLSVIDLCLYTIFKIYTNKMETNITKYFYLFQKNDYE